MGSLQQPRKSETVMVTENMKEERSIWRFLDPFPNEFNLTRRSSLSNGGMLRLPFYYYSILYGRLRNVVGVYNWYTIACVDWNSIYKVTYTSPSLTPSPKRRMFRNSKNRNVTKMYRCTPAILYLATVNNATIQQSWTEGSR